MNRVLANIIKNTNAYRVFERDIENGFCHAYLITSADKIALDNLLTLALARAYCPTACLQCDNCKKVLEGAKPDVNILNPSDEAVSVDQITDMIEDTYLAPVEGGEKIYVIKSIDKQSDLVQNKLLKTLEEPPERVHIILTACSENGILQTVLSRVKKVSQSVFSYSDVYKWLSAEGVFDAKEIASSADGNLTIAEKLAKDDDFAQTAYELLTAYSTINRSADIPKFLTSKLFADLGSDLDTSEIIFKDVLYVKSELDNNLTFSAFSEDYRKLAESLTISSIASIMNEITVAKQKIASSLININILDCFLLKIAEEKSKCKKL